VVSTVPCSRTRSPSILIVAEQRKSGRITEALTAYDGESYTSEGRAIYLFLLLLGSLLLTSRNGWSQASGQENWFDRPEALCSALQSQGFHANTWAPIVPGAPVYLCEYPPVVRPSDSAASIVAMLAKRSAGAAHNVGLPGDLGSCHASR
jgi:hypothetical protein